MAVQVTSVRFVANVGYWLSEALRRPVEITHLGRVRLVLTLPPAAGKLDQPGP